MDDQQHPRKPQISIDRADILQEHVLLDGGLVVELSMRLSDGRTGRVAVGERVIDGKKREMWVLTGPWNDRKEVTRRFTAAPEPVRKRKPRWGQFPKLRSARRLAAVAWLIERHPTILMAESSQYYDLTRDDRLERRTRDHQNRTWRVVRAAVADYGAVVAHLQCTWPQERLGDAEPEAERDNYVLEIGYKIGRQVIRDHRLSHSVDTPIDDKVKAALTSLIFDRYSYASSFEMSDQLAEIGGGLWSAEDARALYSQLLGPWPPRRETTGHSFVRGGTTPLIDTPHLVTAKLMECHDAAAQYRGDATYRVLLFRIKHGSKKTHWMATIHGAKDRIAYLSDDNGYDRVVGAPVPWDIPDYAGHMERHAARLWAVPRAEYNRPDDEEGARRRFAAAVAKDLDNRARNELRERSFTLLAWADLADGGLVMRLRARWGQPDPLLAAMARPKEYVVDVSANGITAHCHAYGGKTSKLYNSDMSPADWRNFVADLKLIRTAPVDDTAAEEARYRLHYALTTAELGYESSWDADAQLTRLAAGCERHEIAATDLWAELGRRRQDITPETLAVAMALPVRTISNPPQEAAEPSHEIAVAETTAPVEMPIAEVLPPRRSGRPKGDRQAMTSTERSRACRARKAATAAPAEPKKRGRPPKGDTRMTDAERARAYRARRRSEPLGGPMKAS
jgi:hypothetical protein